MTEALLVLGVAYVVVTVIGVSITLRRRRRHGKRSSVRVGDLVESIIWPIADVPGSIPYDNTAVGEVMEIRKDGTMVVREWDSGDEHPCLVAGSIPVSADEATIMRFLRREEDYQDIKKGPTQAVH